MGWSCSIEEQYALSPAKEIPGSPCAEHAGADHDHVPAVARSPAGSVETRFSAQVCISLPILPAGRV